MDVQGIEIDDVRVELAKVNCADHGLHDCVHLGSVLDRDLLAQLGTFDVITLVDVIEHVLDVPQTLRNVVDVLNPGGVALLEIPNRHSLQFVAHDGHFNLFGITLLSRPDAIEYHKTFFGFAYDVGDYFDLEYYTGELARLGCTCEVIRSPLVASRAFDEAGPLYEAMKRSHAAYQSVTAHRLSPALRDTIHDAVAQYGAELIQERARADAVFEERVRFETRYLTDFWTVVVRKGPDRC
jgi:SAM-dependent methyltransferase